MSKEFQLFAYYANTLAKGGSLETPELDKLSELAKQLSEFQKASKKLSQLIAKSWLPGGEKIKEVLLSGDEQKVKDLLDSEGIHLADFNIEHIFVNWDSFYGTFTELGFVYYLPYPPRPNEVKDEQLNTWVHDENPNHLNPPYPYIPVTLS